MAKVNNAKPTEAKDALFVAEGVSITGTASKFSLNWYGLIVKGCKVKEGKYGKFISWPSFRTKEGEYIDWCFLDTRDKANEAIRDNIIAALKD